MGCNVVCPYVQGKENQNWGLEDPTGMRDEVFLNIMDEIEKKHSEFEGAAFEGRRKIGDMCAFCPMGTMTQGICKMKEL